jgi:beta-lactamase class D
MIVLYSNGYGEERGLKVWEQDLIFRQAFQFSCVPCYQEVARKIGSERMNQYLTKLRYGDMKVDSSNIDIFWLEGASTINQYQQIDFLKSLYQSELPIRNHTEETIKRMMILDQSEKYRLRGKTGWSIRNGNNNGWFVGYLETENEVYFIAVNINPGKAFDMNLFPMIRKAVAMRTFQLLKIIE